MALNRIILLGVIASAFSFCARAGDAPVKLTAQQMIDAAIVDLGDKDFKIRDAAVATLIKSGEACVKAVTAATAASKSGVFKGTAERVLGALDTGGAEVNGISLVLESDRRTLDTGDTIHFTITMKNTSKKMVTVTMTPMFPAREYFCDGPGFCKLDGLQGQSGVIKTLMASDKEGDAEPEAKQIPANEKVVFTTTAKVVAQNEKTTLLVFGKDANFRSACALDIQ